jgi:hypothetical protein
MRTLSGMKKSEMVTSRGRWAAFVRQRLIPMRLILPVGAGVHEWTPVYRNLIFAMASFAAENGGKVSRELVERFVRRTNQRIVNMFTRDELELLLAKAVEYHLNLAAYDPRPAGAR